MTSQKSFGILREREGYHIQERISYNKTRVMIVSAPILPMRWWPLVSRYDRRLYSSQGDEQKYISSLYNESSTLMLGGVEVVR